MMIRTQALYSCWSKAKETATERGFGVLLSKGLRKLASFCFETHSAVWMEKDLNVHSEEHEVSSDYTIEFDNLKEIVDWMKTKHSDYPWMYHEKEMLVAKEFGHLVPYVKYKDNIVCYTKVALNSVYIRDYERIFRLAPNKAMFYDTTVLSDFRGKRLPRFLKNRIFRILRQQNIEYVYAHIEPWNIPSIKSNEGVGFRRLCINRYIRIGFAKFYSNNPSRFLSYP
jgi:hypothetical protein